MSKTATRGGTDTAPVTRPEAPTERAARERSQRLQYLGKRQGIAELHEALIDIHSVTRETRINGAKKLAELKSAQAFSPLLDVLQKEKDPELRILLLKAMKETVSEPPFNPLFRNAIEPLKKIILSGGDIREYSEAMLTITNCIADHRQDVAEFLSALVGEVSSRYGESDRRFMLASITYSSIERD
jgi:hypothetical protein